MSKRTILITGSTGKQGKALVASLLSAPEPSFHVLALTRSATSKTAESLKSRYPEHALTVVEGNLDDEASIRSIFELQRQKGDAIWGVFCVLAFPGLGVDASGEAAQGKMLANLAFEYRVQSFVYSSAMRAGPKYEAELPPKLSGRAKADVENCCIELGRQGFPWTILRPCFFMENFEDYIGSIAYGVLKVGLKEDTTINLIASEEIGHVAAAVFNNPSKYKQKILTLVAEQLTTAQLNAAHMQALSKPMPALNSWLAWVILKFNGATQGLIRDLELNYHARKFGEYPEHEAEIALAKEAYPMRGYAEWKGKDVVEGEYEGGWNKVGLGKLLTGRM